MTEVKNKKPSAVVATRPKPLAGKPGSSLAVVVSTVRKLEITKDLPPATIVYGCASGVIFAVSFYLLASGHWRNGFLTMLPAFCFLGFALHFMRQGQ